MRIAVIENNTVANIIVADDLATAAAALGVPSGQLLDVDNVPCRIGQGYVAGALVADEVPVPEVGSAPDITVSPVEFKLLWTVPERIAIKALKATDAIVADLFEIMDDTRLETVNMSLQSTQDAVGYILAKLAEGGTIAADTVPARRAAILSGVIQ